MCGGKRRAVIKVYGDGADDDARAGASARGDDVVEVLLKILIDDRESRIICADVVFQKHQHPAPLIFAGWWRAKTARQPIKHLAGARGLKCQTALNERASCGLSAKHRARAE